MHNRFELALFAPLVFALAACPARAASVNEETSETTTTSSTESESGESESTESETTQGECDVDVFHDCLRDARDAARTCKDPCPGDRSCTHEACIWACEVEKAVADAYCFDELYCDSMDDWYANSDPDCTLPCYEEALACAQSPACEHPVCMFEAMVCTDANECDIYQTPELRFDYPGSCEIALSKAVDELRAHYTSLAIPGMDEEWFVLSPGDELACDRDPYLGGHYVETLDAIVLCPAVCALVEAAGEFDLIFGLPSPP